MCKICWESREQRESFVRSQWEAYNDTLDRYMEKPIRKKIRNKGLADRLLEELDRGYYGEY